MRRFVAFMVVLLIIVAGPGAERTMAQTTYYVPSLSADLADVISNVAESGDFVQVSDNDNDNEPYGAIVMKAGVKVYANPGHSPKISGSGADYAVDFPTDATSATILEGFAEITGGTYGAVRVRGSGVVRDCVINAENTGGIDYGILSAGTTTIDGVSVTVTGTYQSYGIHHSGGAPDISGCTVTLSETTSQYSIGIRVDASSPTTGGTVENCTVTMRKGTAIDLRTGSFDVSGATVDFSVGGVSNIGINCGYTVGQLRGHVESCLISVPDGIGVHLADDSTKVSFITMDTVGTGILGYSTDVTVSNCIVTDFGDYDYAFQDVDAEYCIADGTTPYATGSQGTGSVVQDPLYCDATNGAYTLRVDSYGNLENNASGERIGAFDVACMYGTLARDASYSAGGTLEFPGDLTIPSGKTLTLGDATVVEATALSDNQSTGDTDRTELFVYGTLVSDGGATGIEFRSDAGSVSDWGTLQIKAGGAAEIDSTTIRDAGYGLVYASTESGFVTDCTFTNNSEDIAIGSSSGTMDLEISGCTIDKTGSSGSGVYLSNYHGGVTLEGNTITGTSGANNGIHTGASISGFQAVLLDNTIHGFTNGSGIRVDGGASPELRGNTIRDCLYGIRVDNGNPAVGTGSSSSDNFIHDNGYGVYAISSSAAPAIRNSRIYDNDRGVYCISNGAAHLGDGVTSGNNSITGNGYSVGAIHYCRHVVNRSTGVTIPAVGNWWGSCAAPPDSCFMGTVTRSGWLCNQPAGAVGPELTVQSPATSLKVLGAYPNPVTSNTVIRFSVPDGRADIQAHVYDVAGRQVRDLGIASYGPGDHGLRFDGRDDRGRSLPGGIYFIRLAAGRTLVATGRLLVVR